MAADPEENYVIQLVVEIHGFGRKKHQQRTAGYVRQAVYSAVGNQATVYWAKSAKLGDEVEPPEYAKD